MSKHRTLHDKYIKGDYHCDSCPFCWVDQGYDDCDAGCYIFGDLRDSCRLIPPIRSILGYFRKKRIRYHEYHQYDNIGEWYDDHNNRLEVLSNLILKMLSSYDISINYNNHVTNKPETNYIKAEHLIDANIYNILSEYEDAAHPVKHIRLKDKWADALKSTVTEIADWFKMYFGRML